MCCSVCSGNASLCTVLKSVCEQVQVKVTKGRGHCCPSQLDFGSLCEVSCKWGTVQDSRQSAKLSVSVRECVCACVKVGRVDAEEDRVTWDTYWGRPRVQRVHSIVQGKRNFFFFFLFEGLSTNARHVPGSPSMCSSAPELHPIHYLSRGMEGEEEKLREEIWEGRREDRNTIWGRHSAKTCGW